MKYFIITQRVIKNTCKYIDKILTEKAEKNRKFRRI